ncbi:Transposase, IS4 family protein [mine drainage metagenome]|uniref:Transposase, IS4 family protein n=2 Tax=mine drainage metagenome TaxID=410659 RepID=T1ARK1_9ZZZZ
MHIDAVPNRTSRPTYLLRESYRIGKKVRKRTLANLSGLADEQIEAIRAVLAGVAMRPVEELFEVVRSRSHGAVQAVRVAMQRLGFEGLIASRASPERERVCAMVASRVLEPHTKLATTRWWHTTTLAEEYGVEGADEHDLYAAMDWCSSARGRSSASSPRGICAKGPWRFTTCPRATSRARTVPLAKIGHNRDGKKNKLQVNYGLLTNRAGCPVAVSVYEGNTGDAKTLMPQVGKLRDEFGLEQVVLVGDRGMISQKAIGQLRELEGFSWITALKSSQIRSLVEGEALQLGLFDQRRLFELTHEAYPGERLIACRNPELAKLRAHKRQSLLEATQRELEKIRASVTAGRLSGKAKIGVRIGTGGEQVQGRQALRAHRRGPQLRVQDPRGEGRRRGGARWDIRHPHQRAEEAARHGRCRTQLQRAL